MINKIRKYSKFLYGLSPAALVAMIRDGPDSARAVVWQTRKAAEKADHLHVMSYWDFARAFSTPDQLVFDGGTWQDGCTAPLERFCLAQLIRFFSPRQLLEIGTFKGFTTCLMLDNAPDTLTVHTVDLPHEREQMNLTAATDARLIHQSGMGSAYLRHPKHAQVRQVLGDSFRAETWEEIPKTIEFAFIDASHSYEAVKNDTEQVFKTSTDDVVVAWHDYTDEDSYERGIGKYIRELMRNRPDIFVIEGTTLAVRIPLHVLKKQASTVPSFYPADDYLTRHPLGATPWLGTNH